MRRIGAAKGLEYTQRDTRPHTREGSRRVVTAVEIDQALVRFGRGRGETIDGRIQGNGQVELVGRWHRAKREKMKGYIPEYPV